MKGATLEKETAGKAGRVPWASILLPRAQTPGRVRRAGSDVKSSRFDLGPDELLAKPGESATP